MMFSMPGAPSVKYNALLYPSLELCTQARIGYLEAFASKDEAYKSQVSTDAVCIPFESFPVKGLNAEPSRIGA